MVRLVRAGPAMTARRHADYGGAGKPTVYEAMAQHRAAGRDETTGGEVLVVYVRAFGSSSWFLAAPSSSSHAHGRPPPPCFSLDRRASGSSRCCRWGLPRPPESGEEVCAGAQLGEALVARIGGAKSTRRGAHQVLDKNALDLVQPGGEACGERLGTWARGEWRARASRRWRWRGREVSAPGGLDGHRVAMEVVVR
ncbi:hypothetical protein E2562_038047 [Oryza meyeriana var. granulata]|uniref:Uncharacterized protein n=1 Tax=Oryza meyeriana var. granulata TaxID=110450 RepID=A0A6G1EU23_9ORYZ|nr:hypothetical protein E2562_038047 [Oryza meyeriana var. granulata]